MVGTRGRDVILEADEVKPAVVFDYASHVNVNECTVSEKKRYIADNAKRLVREDYIEIGIMIKNANFGQFIRENFDGCRVDLSKITDETLINRIYACVKYKISHV